LVEVRWHGRGGQGAVTAAEILAHAAIEEGFYAQAMPSFGAERRGAPVQAFNRISDKPIRTRGSIKEPDVVVVIDETLLGLSEVVEGIKPSGVFVASTSMKPGELREKLGVKCKVATVDALKVAREVLKVPITNTSMLGAFAKAVGIVKLETLLSKVEERFGPKLGPLNVEAVKRAYEETEVVG